MIKKKGTTGIIKGCIPLTAEKKRKTRRIIPQWEKDICLNCTKPAKECNGDCILEKEIIKNDK